MPRYIVERTFPSGLAVPVNAEDANACLRIVDTNGSQGVTWIHSRVSADKTRTFCILALIAQGLTNAEIAGRLARSGKTVDHHVSAVLRKLNVRSRVEAAMMASRLGTPQD